MPDTKTTMEEIQKIALKRDQVIYSLGSDQARGLKATGYEFAKDNLSVFLNEKIKGMVAEERRLAQEELLQKILEKMNKYEYHKDEVHCTCLAALRDYINEELAKK